MSNNLSGYEFIQTIGKGAMGSVYLARQVALNRFVAIKQVLGAWTGDPQALERFRREARALAKMNHPNVVGIYNLEVAGGDLYMIQEYVHGPTLKQVLGNSRLSTGQALRAIGEVSAALEYAAKQGIMHRDLKPGNVFVTSAGVCKLGDFGLVKIIGGQGNFVTTVGTILGTPSYMSPEQAAGKADIDQRTDVYSLAVMSYELLVGRLPFPPVPGNVMATVEAHISSPPPKPSAIAAGFPARVEEVLLAGLAKEPRKRPKSAGDFWVKLADAAEKAWPGWAGDSDLSAIATAAAPPPPPDSAPGQPAPSAPPVPVPVPPPPAPAGQGSMTLSPIETSALMAGSDETLVRPAAMSPDETVALPARAGLDETIVQGAPLADETVVQGGPIAEETLVQPVMSAAPGQPAGAPTFVPPPAPMPAPAAVHTPPVVFTPVAVQPPIYSPPKAKGRRRRSRFLLPLVALLALAVVAYVVLARPTGPAVAVTRVEAAAQPTVGHCPSASYLFTGRIFTNGGQGDITYQWVQPDGTLAGAATETADRGHGELDVTLSFTYNGNGNVTGEKAQLKVLKPAPVDSNLAPVQYRCP